jgi:hypothetical protein
VGVFISPVEYPLSAIAFWGLKIAPVDVTSAALGGNNRYR